MPGFNKGDQFIIEIEEIYRSNDSKVKNSPKTLYRMKGFNSLLFDKSGLKNLRRFEPISRASSRERTAQFDKGSEFAEKCYKKLSSLSEGEIYQLFGYTHLENVIYNKSLVEIYRKLFNFENEVKVFENEVKVEDVVRVNNTHKYFLVTAVSVGVCSGIFQDGTTISIPAENVTKTRFVVKRVDAWLGLQGREVIDKLKREGGEQ